MTHPNSGRPLTAEEHRRLAFQGLEPQGDAHTSWGPDSDGAARLDAIAGHLRRYVVLSDVQRDALALWTAHTHAFEAADATPYHHITFPERESGKTRLLEALEQVVARPLMMSNTTAAALARGRKEPAADRLAG